ncbi:MAG: thioredoxin family protein [Candidatus Bipolaricaulota bacterium]|nr:MAG: thioredoxin family protein [Candidatus Bipolaricaulota bacterium]
MRDRLGVLVVALLGLFLLAPLACGQEAILTFEWGAETLTIAPGGEARIALVARNGSVYEGDDLELEADLEELGFTLATDPEIVKKIAPFGDATLDVLLAAPADAAEGEIELTISALYTYCIDESCFMLEEPLTLRVAIVPGADPIAATASTRANPWPPIVAALVLAGLAAGLLLGRRTRLRIAGAVGLAVVAVLGLAYGTLEMQHEQAQGIGAVLCMSCVGLEIPSHEPPELSAEDEGRLAALTEPRELLVFSATWCHSCPVAKAFVAAVDDASAAITHRVIDVEEEPETAEAYGVVVSGRTIVPAIVRVDTSELLTGTDHLKARLFELLELPDVEETGGSS